MYQKSLIGGIHRWKASSIGWYENEHLSGKII